MAGKLKLRVVLVKCSTLITCAVKPNMDELKSTALNMKKHFQLLDFSLLLARHLLGEVSLRLSFDLFSKRTQWSFNQDYAVFSLNKKTLF